MLLKSLLDDFYINQTLIWLVVEPTHLKNMLVKLEIFPKFRGENSKNIWVATTE